MVNNAYASRMSPIEEMTQEDSDYITDQTIMVVGGSIKLIQTGQDFTFLRDHIFTHPTMSEALNDLFSQIKE
ncbi:hypothetical protein [Paenibacillus pseudetheri]|uniref:hypothetical protein n=1 Tax=Paenibacillus pseudetheri TaxID=2897682 RepID=UPI001F2E2052|nr:hypothetical protein [Paenibacillus pseudetheri]